MAATATSADKRQRFGAALRRHLKLWGLSQGALADRMGTAQSAVSAWASGKSAPSPERVFELEKIFELSPGTLAGILHYRAPEEGEHRCDIVKAVEENETLSRAHKELLLTMYSSLIELDAGRRPPRRSSS
ncbi:MAG: helix-turn-helix domain-containing protein [Acidimicrobiia bacterium]